MFTVCPGCTRQFQILAEHLAAASGQVRCGFCHKQFNAMDRLHDEPLPDAKKLNDVPPVLETELVPVPVPESDTEFREPEPQFDNAEPKTIEFEQELLINTDEIESDQDLVTAISEIGIRPSVEEIRAGVEKESVEPEKVEPVEESALESHYYFPDSEEALSQEEPVNRNWAWLSPFFWTTAGFIALLILSLQLGWFNRDRVLLEYPELIPYAKQFCLKFDCRLIRQRDTRAIKLINRDVRLHPDYRDVLLVNAAMKNELSIRQPYPRVQLTLYDTSGSLLAYREFVPNDYLDDSIEIDKGMPIESPVYFVLEVSAPTAGAVSFEFRFL